MRRIEAITRSQLLSLLTDCYADPLNSIWYSGPKLRSLHLRGMPVIIMAIASTVVHPCRQAANLSQYIIYIRAIISLFLLPTLNTYPELANNSRCLQISGCDQPPGETGEGVQAQGFLSQTFIRVANCFGSLYMSRGRST